MKAVELTLIPDEWRALRALAAERGSTVAKVVGAFVREGLRDDVVAGR